MNPAIASSQKAFKDYYDVPKATYLYPKRAMLDEFGNPKPEEKVRQWCSFELIRSYGYSIIDLSFEHPARVGSKTYRIDILIQRDDEPFAVIECKRRSFKKHSEALEQAQSYADSKGVKAKFAAYTNGSVWFVSRKVGSDWFPCSDLPKEIASPADESLEELYDDLHSLGTLIHRLDSKLSGEEARQYLDALQVFFHATNRFTQSTNKDLRFGADLALRAILHYKSNDVHYVGSKVRSCLASIEKFRVRTELGHRFYPIGDDAAILEIFWEIRNYLSQIRRDSEDFINENSLLISFLAVLFEYAKNLPEPGKPYPEFPASLHHSLRRYLALTTELHLGMELPTQEKGNDFKDLQQVCFERWEEHKRRW